MRFMNLWVVLAVAGCAGASPTRETAAEPADQADVGAVRAAEGGHAGSMDCAVMAPGAEGDAGAGHRMPNGAGGRGMARIPMNADRERGRRIFTSRGNCHACHGSDARGTRLAPDLMDDEWLHGAGSARDIHRVMMHGVPAPKVHPAPMPPMGGAELTMEDVHDLTAFILERN